MKNFLTRKKASMNREKNAHKKPGFTLVEILIVVAVIGILFISLVPKIDFAGDKARETGVKTDFRSFELAAEQVLRENGGVSGIDTVATLCAENKGVNLYLDKAIQFSTTGSCAKQDQWNQPYTVQVVKQTGSAGANINPNNGTIIFISNGQDSFKSKTDDNYAIAVTYVDGQISSETIGFSSNIDSSMINPIANGSAAKMEADASTKVATVTYAKGAATE